ncbi:hypothetical protein [Caldinitratiruptor microaerophilus]|uniref:Uncharacterized protein n=1 Tax=Caldinitratiruptor microaerophilus TaxID=671077 RepID=A0AA35CIE9_9FIRM|nr:hypothetical protein [Caldinitratiruptor microaerophilus]BDG59714.1 hypothetical protein caldi_08040 [Caldinitratiruptor microaerophilus]
MVTYGIYPGVARKDALTALCHYRWDDYRRVFGGDLRAYLDFLIEQEEAARYGDDGPYRVVRVPFVPQRFAEWLAGHPGWKDDPDGHGAWALDVAQDPDALRAIRDEVPLLTRAPAEEKTASSTFFIAFLTMYGPDQDPGPLGRTLPSAFLAEVGETLRASLADLPPFTPLSRLRSEGIAIVPGNRFVDPDRAEDAAELLESQVLREVRQGSPPGTAVPVPRSLRLHAEADPDSLQTVVLLLPVVVVGPQELIDYVEEKWAAVGDPVGRALGECFHRHLRLPAPPPGVYYEATIVPPYLAGAFVNSVFEELDALDDLDLDDYDEDDEDEDDDFPQRPPGRHGPPGPHGRRHIRRIK